MLWLQGDRDSSIVKSVLEDMQIFFNNSLYKKYVKNNNWEEIFKKWKEFQIFKEYKESPTVILAFLLDKAGVDFMKYLPNPYRYLSMDEIIELEKK